MGSLKVRSVENMKFESRKQERGKVGKRESKESGKVGSLIVRSVKASMKVGKWESGKVKKVGKWEA